MNATDLALAKALLMKLQGIKIRGYRIKDGKPVKADRTPGPLKIGKRKKADRQTKAWKAKSK